MDYFILSFPSVINNLPIVPVHLNWFIILYSTLYTKNSGDHFIRIPAKLLTIDMNTEGREEGQLVKRFFFLCDG